MDFPPTPLPLHFFKASHKSGGDIDVLCSPMLGKGLSPCATGDSACRIPNQTSNLQVLKFCFVYFFSDSLFITALRRHVRFQSNLSHNNRFNSLL